MELVTRTLQASSFNSKPILLCPLGDIQFAGDDKEVALKMLRRHCEWVVDNHPDALFIGMGDYTDSFSPSNRQRVRAAGLYDTAEKSLDQIALKYTEDIYTKALEVTKGRWLGLLSGHHYHNLLDGRTTDQVLAERLGAPFLGTSAYARLRFTYQHHRGDVLIWAHHGEGGGSTAASILNKLKAKSAEFDGDIFLMGHCHMKVAQPIDRVYPIFPNKGGEPDLMHRTIILAGCGSFLKGYRAGAMIGKVPRGNYAEQKMLSPLALGAPLIKVGARWKHTKAGSVWSPDLGVEL